MMGFRHEDEGDFTIISRLTVAPNPIKQGDQEEAGLSIVNSFQELRGGQSGPFDITALQVLCAFAKNGASSALRCRLLENKEHINVSDYLGRTPLLYSTLNGNSTMVEVLLDHGANTECKLRCDSAKISGDKDKLNGNLQRYKELFQKLPLFGSPLNNISGRTPLHVAVKEGNVDIVKLLVLKGANVNSTDDKGITPLLLAGCNSLEVYEEITKILVLNGADVTRRDSTGTTALHHSVHFGSYNTTKLLMESGAWISTTTRGENELHVSSLKGFAHILQTFLKDPRINSDDINQADLCGKTPAYKAAYADRKDCLKLLLNKGADLTSATKNGETVSDKLFKNVSNPMKFLREVLNDNVQNDVDDGVMLNFGVLAPIGSEQMSVLHSLFDATDEQEKLEILQHPLIEAYLNLKWSKAKPFFYFLILSYVIFVLSLSVYILMLVKKITYVWSVSVIAKFVLTVSASGLLIHAIIQGVVMWKHLWHKFEVWMNITSTIIALSVVAFTTMDGFAAQSQEWVLHTTSIAVLLAWTELMLLVGRFPNLGYYALMFGAVLLNVIKVLSTFICLVIGFALCFSIQFYKDHTFNDLWMALVKTTVMMIGEFEYVELFSSMHATGIQVTARIIFFLFVIVVSIVLMNLMVGLAVSDIQGLQMESSARRLEKQAEFLQQLEKVIGKVVKWKFLPKWMINFLRKRKSIPLKFTVKAEWCSYRKRRSFERNKLSHKLIESLQGIGKANRRSKVDLTEKQMMEIIGNIKLLIDNYGL